MLNSTLENFDLSNEYHSYYSTEIISIVTFVGLPGAKQPLISHISCTSIISCTGSTKLAVYFYVGFRKRGVDGSYITDVLEKT